VQAFAPCLFAPRTGPIFEARHSHFRVAIASAPGDR
jgi:hypothetical protein